MSIESQADLDGLRAAGRVVAKAIRAMRARVRPGVSTGELDLLAAGVGEVFEADDGWTYKTVDESCSAHFEHTLVVTEDAPILLNAPGPRPRSRSRRPRPRGRPAWRRR